jgi:hypothetical protein
MPMQRRLVVLAVQEIDSARVTACAQRGHGLILPAPVPVLLLLVDNHVVRLRHLLDGLELPGQIVSILLRQ